MTFAWWHIFFRLANLGVFIGFIVYLYQRYVKDIVNRGLDKEKQLLDGLQKEYETVVRSHEGYKSSMVCKQKEQALMCVMVRRWQQHVANDNAQRLAEKEALTVALRHKAERQADLAQTEQIVQAVLPLALNRAQRDLEDFFADDQEGREFVKRIIIRVRE